MPVINGDGRLAGLITKYDAEDALFQGNPPDTPVWKIMNPSPSVISPEDSLYLAYFRLHAGDTKWLVVTDRKDRVRGIITRFDINSALETKIMPGRELQ